MNGHCRLLATSLFALAACASTTTIRAQSTNQQAITLAINGIVAPGQTVTLTATVTGLHKITLLSHANPNCNVNPITTVSISDGSAVIGTVWANETNSTNVTYQTSPGLQTNPCKTLYLASADTTVYSVPYQIPKGARSVNLVATFNALAYGSTPAATLLQSQPVNKKFNTALPAIVDLLLND